MPRVKAHFKVHLSLGNHAKTAAMFADNDLLATWLRLGMLAVERRAALTSDIFVVRREELPTLTGQKRGDSALRVWKKLLTSCPVVANYSEPIWTVEFPKFAEKQGFNAKNVGPLILSLSTEEEKKVPTEPVDDGQTASTTDGEKPTNVGGSAESDEQPTTRPDTRPADARRVWPDAARAAAKYGKRWSPKPSDRRIVLMAARLREFPTANPDVLVRAVHGAVKSWNRDEVAIAKWLRPETVYRRSNFEKYIEAYNEPEPPDKPRGQRSGTARDNTVRGAVERLADRYGIGDEEPTVDVRSTVQRISDE